MRRSVIGHDDDVDVTYRQRDDGWEALLSTGQRLPPAADLAAARAAARVLEPAAETVQVPLEGHGVVWAGLRFEMVPPTYGADAPTEEQNARLLNCFQYYRDRLPAGMRVECAGNRVRIEPGPIGLVDAVFQGAGDQRRRLDAAAAIPVPAGFVRVVHDFVGLDEVGYLHLVLRERWHLDQPCW